MRILASKIRHIGDIVLWTSALESLRTAFPDAQIEVLTLPFGAAILKGHSAVNRVHTVEEGRWPLAKALWRLRQNHYDYFLGFHAGTSLCRMAPLLHADEKVLHHHSWQKTPRASTRPVPHAGDLEHSIRRDHRVLEAIGIVGPAPLPRLYISDEEKALARAKLAARSGSQKTRFLALVPGARSPLRRYPEDLWKSYVRRLAKVDTERGIVVIADREQSREWHLDEFCEGNEITLFSDQSLREVLALLSICESAAGNDSGLTHAAAALGLRTLSIFGPGCFGDWGPPDPVKNRVARTHVDCRVLGPRDREAFQYCTVSQCDHHSCMRKLSPQMLVDIGEL